MHRWWVLTAMTLGCSSPQFEGTGREDFDEDAGATSEIAAADTATPSDDDTGTEVVDSALADLPDTAMTADTPDRGPAYAAGTAACPSGGRKIKLVNNCKTTRWFKLDGRTTPMWGRPTTCPWAGESCSDNEKAGQCTPKAKAKTSADPGSVYCKSGTCACNPYFELAPGKAHEIALPPGASFPSGTGWLASECNPNGSKCRVGEDAAKNSTFEWTYDEPGKGALYYDISAVNAWTTVSAVGMKTCGGKLDPKDKFRCNGAGCRFDVATQCPNGSAALAGAPSGCTTCPTKTVGGKQVIDGSCGPCPNGASANKIPTNTVFNAGGIGGPEWSWKGDSAFATSFGADQGVHANRKYACIDGVCRVGSDAVAANTCLGGCDLCIVTKGVSPDHPDCIKYCCPDMTKTYSGATYRYDSAGCTALGVQAGTDYTATLKAACPYVYTYGYEDHSSTFICDTDASLLVQACPDEADFPSKLK